MPSGPECTPPPPCAPWTPTTAQAALTVAAWQIQEALELLEGIHRDLPPPPDLADRQEHRKPYDVTTDVLATIECVLADDLRPAIASLQRSAEVTDDELARDFQEREAARIRHGTPEAGA
jgi:hypothetical protein